MRTHDGGGAALLRQVRTHVRREALPALAPEPDVGRRTLVLFSDMRQSTPDLNLESLRIVPSFSSVAKRCGALPDFHNVQVYFLGVDGAGRSTIYWESLQCFWTAYFHNAGAVLENYSVLRELPQIADFR
jgi:hypothetical protein